MLIRCLCMNIISQRLFFFRFINKALPMHYINLVLIYRNYLMTVFRDRFSYIISQDTLFHHNYYVAAIGYREDEKNLDCFDN